MMCSSVEAARSTYKFVRVGCPKPRLVLSPRADEGMPSVQLVWTRKFAPRVACSPQTGTSPRLQRVRRSTANPRKPCPSVPLHFLPAAFVQCSNTELAWRLDADRANFSASGSFTMIETPPALPVLCSRKSKPVMRKRPLIFGGTVRFGVFLNSRCDGSLPPHDPEAP